MHDQTSQPRTLGTALRHLLELLDGDVQAIYREEGMDYRPRYTPIMRALSKAQPIAIRDLALTAGITHSAASQTVATMKRAGLVEQVSGRDGRERAVKLTRRGRALLPRLEVRWAATNAAARELDRELSTRLTQCVSSGGLSIQTAHSSD